jgi:hypothetical protein
MTTEASATPWNLDSAKMEGTVDSRYQIIHGQLPKELSQKDAAYGYPVADTMNRHYCISPEEDAANARLIVQAVNSHAGLVAALEAARKQLGWMCVPNGKGHLHRTTTEDTGWFVDWLLQAEAALKLAKGEK